MYEAPGTNDVGICWKGDYANREGSNTREHHVSEDKKALPKVLFAIII
jgi:hypothetical protein